MISSNNSPPVTHLNRQTGYFLTLKRYRTSSGPRKPRISWECLGDLTFWVLRSHWIIGLFRIFPIYLSEWSSLLSLISRFCAHIFSPRRTLLWRLDQRLLTLSKLRTNLIKISEFAFLFNYEVRSIDVQILLFWNEFALVLRRKGEKVSEDAALPSAFSWKDASCR